MNEREYIRAVFEFGATGYSNGRWLSVSARQRREGRARQENTPSYRPAPRCRLRKVAVMTAQEEPSRQGDGIHSCGYYCHRPACIKAQRDELRDKLFATPAPEQAAQTSGALTDEQIDIIIAALAEWGVNLYPMHEIGGIEKGRGLIRVRLFEACYRRGAQAPAAPETS